MAAHSNNFIRVRLHFDYAPPAVVDCRMCWLLVDLNTCRVVADLESIIKDKFELTRRSILSLFIQDCYLPHTESIHVVRDNDSIRVKVACLAQVNGDSSSTDAVCGHRRKRQRVTEEDGPGENGLQVEWKKKKRKKGNEESLEREAKQASGEEKSKKSPGKHKEKKKKKAVENGHTVKSKAAASSKKSPARPEQPVKRDKKPPVAQTKTQSVSSSHSSSSSSEEEEDAPKKTTAKKSAPKTAPSTNTVPKAPLTTKPLPTKPHPRSSSSSSSSDSSSDEAPAVKKQLKKAPTATGLKGQSEEKALSQQKQGESAAAPPRDKTTERCSSSSEEEIELVIRRPVLQPSWRGRGRGQAMHGGAAERGRGAGRRDSRGRNGRFESSCNGSNGPSYQTDSLTNTSVVLQNAPQSTPKLDYSALPLLAAPPQVGQKIAFKLLELTENYTPEVSDYKEGKIMSFDPATKQIELELHNASQAPAEPGKFDLVYQNPDGSERVEYAVSRGSWVTERWDSLLEPRLII